MNLYQINQEIANVLEQAIDIDTGEVIDEQMIELYDKLTIDRAEKVENIACFIKNLKAEAEALKNEKMAFAKRQQSAENKIKSLQNYLKACLSGEKFKTEKCSISYRKSESVEVVDIEKVPEEFIRYKEPEVDKTNVKLAIKTYEKPIPGVQLVEKQSIIIK